MEEESRKIKTWWDLRGVGQWGWGYMCGGEKTREKKKKKNNRMDGKKVKRIKNHN